MKLFIYEYFTSGAAQDQDGLKQIGFAMLDAVLRDFSQIRELQLFTMLDQSLHKEVFKAPYKSEVHIDWHENGKKDAMAQFEDNVNKCDAVLIIAPETGSLIAKLTAIAERCGKMILGSPSSALELVCNKADCISLLAAKGLPVPRSEVFSGFIWPDDKDKILRRFSLPLIIKPLYGAGGQGVRLIKTGNQLDLILQQLAALGEDTFLMQEFIPGQAVSVSCFILDGRGIPLSLNKQIIRMDEELLIQGITVPYTDKREQEIFNIALAACGQIEGLKGFVGIDMVSNSSGPVLIEINSRITMAYAALREAANRNLAKDLWLLCREHKLPVKPEFLRTFTYIL